MNPWWYGDKTGRDPASELDLLRRSVALILGEDEEIWPQHGNAPLAIATALAIASALAEQRREELEKFDKDRDRIVADAHQMTRDLQAIAQELGISARPYSGHEAMERDILPAIRRLRQIEAVYESMTTRKIPRESLIIGTPTTPTVLGCPDIGIKHPSAAIIERHIEAQAAEIERLRKFVREVLYDHLEIDKQSQCPWCLWVPGRSWEPIHECSAIEMVQVVGTSAAGEAKS